MLVLSRIHANAICEEHCAHTDATVSDLRQHTSVIECDEGKEPPLRRCVHIIDAFNAYLLCSTSTELTSYLARTRLTLTLCLPPLHRFPLFMNATAV